jgi:hypothetical protein
MARTIQEIYNEAITEKENLTSLDALVPNPDTAQTLLSDLSSTSKVAIWRLFVWLVSFLIWTHEQIFAQHVIQIEETASQIVPGVARWYKNQALLFQLGYSLEWDGDKYTYSDTTSEEAVDSRIITQAAAIDVSGQVQIKVAKGTLGSFSALSTDEKLAFDAYIELIQFAGVDIVNISAVADWLKLYYTVEYDPLVLDSEGKLLSDGATKPVEVAILNHIQALPFNSDLRITKLTDSIQEAEGVVNLVCDSADGSSNAGSTYTDILADSLNKYESYSGYMIIDTGFPLSSTITYEA